MRFRSNQSLYYYRFLGLFAFDVGRRSPLACPRIPSPRKNGVIYCDNNGEKHHSHKLGKMVVSHHFCFPSLIILTLIVKYYIIVCITMIMRKIAFLLHLVHTKKSIVLAVAHYAIESPNVHCIIMIAHFPNKSSRGDGETIRSTAWCSRHCY